MLYINKQKMYNLIFGTSLLFAFISNFFIDTRVNEVAALPVCNCVIVIDAGHGSPDGGAVSKNGTLEKDINLSVAKHLGSYLQKCGAYVIYTREDDISIGDDHMVSIGDIKKSDMKNRKDIIKNSNADIFVSIHMNMFEQSSYSGAQVFYQTASPESAKLAEHIQKNIRKNVDRKNTRTIKDSRGEIYILKDNKMPSVLVECGFLSNPAEEERLNDDKYRQKLAFAIFSGIAEYVSTL